MPNFLRTLKFQIAFAITLLTLLFISATLYSLHVIDLQHSNNVLVRLAGQLQFNQQHLTVQAMRYHENAPRDYPSYYRDLRLYFVDLKKTRMQLDQLIEAFAGNRFDTVLDERRMAMPPRLPPSSHMIAQSLAAEWRLFTDKLDERIGPDSEEPRLEWAADWISQNNTRLEQANERLFSTLRADVNRRAQRANRVHRILLGMALLVSVLTMLWFYRSVLAPLSGAVQGFQKVANGDFSHRVNIEHNNEIGSLVESFNHLSGRLDALRRLLTDLEQGADLDGTLRTVSRSLPSLIPVDWIGVLVLGPEGRFHLEKAFSDGAPQPIGRLSFDPENTLLEECINNREPLHVADVKGMAHLSDAYVFLNELAGFGRRDAVFLPLGSGQVHGVAVFASRYPNNFRTEHLALLRNLGVLLGVSLGRTIQLTENSRLASIGQFASGIVHEIRTPLTTINLALEHCRQLDDLPESARKRIDLAAAESARLERLLGEILLYAKPLQLQRVPVDMVDVVADTIAHQARSDDIFEIISKPCPLVAADRDRIRQVLLNLIHNAQQAAPQGSPIRVNCAPQEDGWIQVELHNEGEPIPPRVLERIYQPFVTTKGGGTGLGMAIVRRMVDAHGGTIEIRSDAVDGTLVTLRLPAQPTDA